MTLIKKLDRLLVTEIVTLTFVIAASLSSIMIMGKLPRYSEILFSAPDTALTFFMLLLYIFPNILKLTLPISLLLASAIVTIRMAADRELEAWMSSGVSVLRFAAIPSVLGFIVMFISIFSALFFEPYSNRQFDKFQWLQSRSAVEAFLRNTIVEKSFIYDVADTEKINLLLYFGGVSSDKSKFDNVFMGLQLNKNSLFSILLSQSGALKKYTNEGFPDFLFELSDGIAYSARPAKSTLPKLMKSNPNSYLYPKNTLLTEVNPNYQLYPNPSDWVVTEFENMNISLVNAFRNRFKQENLISSGSDRLYPNEYFQLIEKEKSMTPNWTKNLKITERYLFIYKQLVIPFSTLFLPIIGVCLGIQDPRRKQYSVYLGLGIVIFLLYASISVCQQLAISFLVGPEVMLILPPAVLLGVIFILMRWRLFNPPSTGFLEFLREDLLYFVFKRKRIK